MEVVWWLRFGLIFFSFCHILLSVLAANDDWRLVTRNILLDENIYFELLEPEAISYFYKIRPAKDFGPDMNTSFSNIELVITDPMDACGSIQNAPQLRGAVALIERGGCSFLSKTIRVEQAGAIAAIITDHDYDNNQVFVDMINDGTDRTTSIPAFFMLGKDGYMIRHALEQLGVDYAIINIPLNVTGADIYNLRQPPWTLW